MLLAKYQIRLPGWVRLVPGHYLHRDKNLKADRKAQQINESLKAPKAFKKKISSSHISRSHE
ncbi:hypothetical protein GQX74_010932 [Glossina fuscipes]|nr:hypothetical protein GQX74_010932 [Glossina fuscipes]